MNTYLKLWVEGKTKTLILRNPQISTLKLPQESLLVVQCPSPNGLKNEPYYPTAEILTGVEVDRFGQEKSFRYGGKLIDERIHVIQLSLIRKQQVLLLSRKYGDLVTPEQFIKEDVA